MDFRILGSLEVWEGERQIELGGPKRRAVLAYLLLHANEVVAADRLVDQLWGEKPPRNAAGALQTHVSRLRKDLGAEVVATRGWGYVLRSEPGALDLERFERLTAQAENLPARERAESLREALALWRGRPLEDLAFEAALAGDIARLEELRLTVLENRIDADLEAGNGNGLVAELEALIVEYPLRERLRGQLILALYRCGRQAEALEVYRETRRALADELGLEPSPELRELERAILQQDPALRVSPVGAAVVAEPGSPAGRRRRAFVGAAAALLLAGLGTATAVGVSRRPTTTVAEQPMTLITVVANNTDQTGSQPQSSTGAGRATTPTGQSSRQNTTPTKSDARSRGLAIHTPGSTQSTATATVPLLQPQKGTPGKKKPKLIRIADEFGAPALNAQTWNSGSSGPGASFLQANGQLVFSIAGDATLDPQYHYAGSGITTKCEFHGNFDARIDFTVLQWPPQNGATISLTAQAGSTAVELVQRVTAAWDDGYNAWPSGNSTSIPDQSGTLRLARSDGFVFAYYLHDGRWIVLGGKSFSGDVQVGVGLDVYQDTWQQQDVSAAVDNFRVTAPGAACPASS